MITTHTLNVKEIEELIRNHIAARQDITLTDRDAVKFTLGSANEFEYKLLSATIEIEEYKI